MQRMVDDSAPPQRGGDGQLAPSRVRRMTHLADPTLIDLRWTPRSRPLADRVRAPILRSKLAQGRQPRHMPLRRYPSPPRERLFKRAGPFAPALVLWPFCAGPFVRQPFHAGPVAPALVRGTAAAPSFPQQRARRRAFPHAPCPYDVAAFARSPGLLFWARPGPPALLGIPKLVHVSFCTTRQQGLPAPPSPLPRPPAITPSGRTSRRLARALVGQQAVPSACWENAPAQTCLALSAGACWLARQWWNALVCRVLGVRARARGQAQRRPGPCRADRRAQSLRPPDPTAGCGRRGL